MNRTSMAQFFSGDRAMRDNLADTRVSTVFAATCSGGNQFAIWQLTNGSTVWRITDTVAEDECLCLYTTLEGFTIRIDNGVDEVSLTFPFRDVQDMRSLYDFYTIDRVEITMFTGGSWQSNTFAAGPASSNILQVSNPVIVYGHQQKDSNPTILEQLLCYDNMQMKQLAVNSPIEMSYTPSANMHFPPIPVFSPKLSTDPEDEDVEHFGIKMIPMGFTAIPPEDTPIASVTFVVKQYITFYSRRSV